MNWEQITAWIDKFTNKPLVYGIFIVLVSFACAFILFSQTSIGKKTLKKLTSLYNLGHQKANDTLKKVEDVERLANEKIEGLKADYEQKAADIENKCDQKVAFLISVVNFYEESTFSILEKVPNAHVQEELTKFKQSYQAKKKEISDAIGVIYQDHTLALEKAKEEIRKEYDDKIDFLENEIKEFNLYLSELKKEEEPNDGEREESTDSNPDEETLQKPVESL